MPAFREADPSMWGFRCVFEKYLQGQPAVRDWAPRFAKMLDFWKYSGSGDDEVFSSTDSASRLKKYLERIAVLPSDRYLAILGEVSDEAFHTGMWQENTDYLQGILHDVAKISKPDEVTRGGILRVIGERKGVPKLVWEDSKE